DRERNRIFARAQDERIAVIASVLHAGQQLAELRVGEQRKQRYALEYLRIQRKLCRHVTHPGFLFCIAAPGRRRASSTHSLPDQAAGVTPRGYLQTPAAPLAPRLRLVS